MRREFLDVIGSAASLAREPAGTLRSCDRMNAAASEERGIGMPMARRPSLFFAHLFGPCVEPGHGPIHLPKLHIVAVDEPPRGFDGGLIINTIQLNHANRSVV